jgi:hypothetical protein
MLKTKNALLLAPMSFRNLPIHSKIYVCVALRPGRETRFAGWCAICMTGYSPVRSSVSHPRCLVQPGEFHQISDATCYYMALQF